MYSVSEGSWEHVDQTYSWFCRNLDVNMSNKFGFDLMKTVPPPLSELVDLDIQLSERPEICINHFNNCLTYKWPPRANY